MKKNVIFTLLILTIFCINLEATQTKSTERKFEVKKLGNNLYKLFIFPVSVVASVGPDGVLLSDAAYESTAQMLLFELKKLGNNNIKFIINTHWHHDHTGGNKIFGKEAVIIAHYNVTSCLSKDQILFGEIYKAYPEYARPDVTFDGKLKIYFNNSIIEIIPLPGGHTQGDVIVYFRNSNVLHIGDIIFADMFPVIELENGASIKQLTENLQKIIEIMPAKVKIIPGHGRDYTIEDLKKYRRMIFKTIDIVKEEMLKGKSLEEMKKENILKDWENWGIGPIKCNDWVEMIYKSLSKNKK